MKPFKYCDFFGVKTKMDEVVMKINTIYTFLKTTRRVCFCN